MLLADPAGAQSLTATPAPTFAFTVGGGLPSSQAVTVAGGSGMWTTQDANPWADVRGGTYNATTQMMEFPATATGFSLQPGSGMSSLAPGTYTQPITVRRGTLTTTVTATVIVNPTGASSPSTSHLFSYTEPATNADGTALTDLVATRIYWRVNDGLETMASFAASSAKGGLLREWTISIPYTSGTLSMQATAVDVNGNESARSTIASKVIASGPVPPTTFTLTTTPVGAGTITGAGNYPSGTVVTPVATAAEGSTFSAWSGDCSGSGACTVTMTAAKSVTATFTTTPPVATLPPAPSNLTASLGTQDATGVTFSVAWTAVTTATSYNYTAGLNDGSANQQGTVTPPNLLLKLPYLQTGAAGTGFVCVKSVNAAGPSADATCTTMAIPPKVVAPLPTGTLTVDAQVSRCNYFLTAEPPDATGGWVAQFYRDGATAVGAPISTPPYKRSVELYAPAHSFTVKFTKTGQVTRTPAAVTRACP